MRGAVTPASEKVSTNNGTDFGTETVTVVTTDLGRRLVVPRCGGVQPKLYRLFADAEGPA
jgi:hypothetical protein